MSKLVIDTLEEGMFHVQRSKAQSLRDSYALDVISNVTTQARGRRHLVSTNLVSTREKLAYVFRKMGYEVLILRSRFDVPQTKNITEFDIIIGCFGIVSSGWRLHPGPEYSISSTSILSYAGARQLAARYPFKYEDPINLFIPVNAPAFASDETRLETVDEEPIASETNCPEPTSSERNEEFEQEKVRFRKYLIGNLSLKVTKGTHHGYGGAMVPDVEIKLLLEDEEISSADLSITG